MIYNTLETETKTNASNLPLHKELSIGKVRVNSQKQIDAMVNSTPDYEKDTYSIQETEWVAYHKFAIENPSIPNTVLTPNCDIIAVNREITREALLAKIGIKVQAVFQILGLQQKKVDDINLCVTMNELEVLMFTYGL